MALSPLLFLSLFVNPAISSDTEENQVILLSADDFDQALNTYNLLMVKFHAPWCGDCQKLITEYKSAAKNLTSHSPPVKFAEVNVEEDWELAHKYGVAGIPSMKFFRKKIKADVPALLKGEKITEWVLDNSHFVHYFDNTAKFLEFEAANKVTVAFLRPQSASELKTFEKLSTLFDSLAFAVCTDVTVSGLFENSEGSLWLLIKKGNQKLRFSGDFQLNQITEFLDSHRFPTVVKLNEDVEQVIFKGKPALFLFTEQISKFLDTLKALEDFSEGLILTHANLKFSLHFALEEKLGVNSTDQPIVMIVDTRNAVKKYLMKQLPTLENLKNFIVDWKTGKLPVFYKSEDSIEFVSSDSVVRVIGKDFNHIVKNPKKNVLIYFFDPDSVECQSFEKDYRRLADKFRDNFSVLFGIINMKKNEVEGEEVTRLPSLKLYPAGDKTPREYYGAWNEKEVAEFIELNAINKQPR